MQNKILEYMALGIPAITSIMGFEGMDATPNLHLLVARSPDEWTERICELLAHPEKRRAMAIDARALVESRYSWDAMISPLRHAIAQRLASRTHRAA